ncbi:MAG: hypothetical protein ACFCUG_16405 [Thiotrichales bacterium]
MIIFLNGVTAAGKSTVASALSQMMESPTITLQLDAFHVALNTPYNSEHWPLYRETAKGLHLTSLVWHQMGFHVILDTVLDRHDLFLHAHELLPREQTCYVGVMADLATLNSREMRRKNPRPDFVAYQFDHVHKDIAYDLTVDTGALNPIAAALRIYDHLRSAYPEFN